MLMANEKYEDRKYAIELLFKIKIAGPRISDYLQGNWCDTVIGYLLRDGLVEIKEVMFNSRGRSGAMCSQFYVPTEKGEKQIEHIVERAFENGEKRETN